MRGNKPKAYSYIRFSTTEQRKGDSLRRQLELSENYANDNNLTLDKTLKMKDLGLSAFKGEHTSKGALGVFLKLVKTGKISKNSVLIVESLDRLSRKTVLDALEQFMSLINNGISIVTLQDNMTYSKKTVEENYTQLIISISIMSRAHEESATKSKRLKAAWVTKRKHLHDKKLTGKCPAWLKLNKEKQEFELITERAKIIKRIFKIYLSGKGIISITKQLNNEHLENWGPRKTGWHKSYIQKILHNKAVIGEFQPGKLENNKPVSAGNIIKNYFPSVVTPDEFYRVQEKLKANTFFGGKTGKLNNLFTRLAKCAYCGSNMTFQDKGKPPKGGKYLLCGASHRGAGCNSKALKYNPFEKTILEYCIGLNVNELMDNNENQSKISNLLDQQTSIKGQLDSIKLERNNLIQAITNASDETVQKILMDELKEKNNKSEKLENKNATISTELNQLISITEDTKEKLTTLKTLYEVLESANDQERIDLRVKLRSKLRELINGIVVFPNGYTDEWIELLINANKKQYPNFKQEAFSNIRESFQAKNKEIKSSIIIINFSSGIRRTLYPEITGRQCEDFVFDGQAVITKSKTGSFTWNLKTNEQTSTTYQDMNLYDALFYVDGKNNSKQIQKGTEKCKICLYCFDAERNKCPTVKICSQFDQKMLDKKLTANELDKAIINTWFEDDKKIKCLKFVKRN